MLFKNVSLESDFWRESEAERQTAKEAKRKAKRSGQISQERLKEKCRNLIVRKNWIRTNYELEPNEN